MKTPSHFLKALFIFAMLLLGAGCNVAADGSPTPTAEVIQRQTATATPSAEPVMEPSNTSTQTPTVVAPRSTVVVVTPSNTPQPQPTPSPSPTQTLGPWEYTIQPGDTLLAIIGRAPYNYTNQDVMDAIVALNPNMFSRDVLPPVGETILIPRPTATSTPAAVSSNDAGVQTLQMRPNADLPPWSVIGQHSVSSGENVASIINRYNMTMEQFSWINAAVEFIGCNFELPTGGANCNPLIREGQTVNVLYPTPTMTRTPTPSGQETPTATPTHGAAVIITPPDGSVTSGPVTLAWVSVGRLQPDEVYIVQVTDQTAGIVVTEVTRSTNLRLDDSLIPTDGQPHQIEWSITIGRQVSDGTVVPIASGLSVNRFVWQSA